MGKALRGLWIVLLILTGFVLLQACATKPAQVAPSAEESLSKPGLYVNSSPAFSVEYPKHWVSDKKQQDTEVLRVVNTNLYKVPSLVVGIDDLEEGAVLENAAKDYIEVVRETNPGTKRFKILSEKRVTLNDDTPAVALTFKWSWSDGMTKLQSAALVIHKEGKIISLIATTILGGDTSLEKLLGMVLSFKFV